jgi:hypothetical protein
VAVQYKPQVDSLQSEMKGYLHEDRQTLIKSLDKNTETIDRNAEMMNDVKFYLQNDHRKN